MIYTKKIILLAVAGLTIFNTFLLAPALADPTTPPSAVESAIRQDLSRRTGLKPQDFTLRTSVSKTWPDGCLGLGKKDELCTQVLVPGWLLTLGYQNKIWTYRSDNSGRNIRLE